MQNSTSNQMNLNFNNINIAKVFGFVALMIVASYITTALPIGEGIPITGQSLAVLLIGYYCGIYEVLLVFLIYFILGLAGLPVFADGGSGVEALVGKSGGYLYSFPIAASLISYFEYNKNRAISYTFQSFLMATILILAMGVLHLSLSIGLNNAILYGFKPFWLGGLIKILFGLIIVYGFNLAVKKQI